jgi:hypothetical protein
MSGSVITSIYEMAMQQHGFGNDPLEGAELKDVSMQPK